MKPLRFRQIHLDFHTSPFIPGIGSAFDKAHWQGQLQKAHVDSITCFSSCHHGWSYHPTEVGQMHPHLDFDLLRAQVDACKEIDVKVPVYMTAGVNNATAHDHPEWREVSGDGQYQGWTSSPLSPGFQTMCFNTPYLDYLCDMIRETVRLFPEADGIFLDIISQGACCCRWCVDDMRNEGIDPNDIEQRYAFARRVLMKYYEKTTQAVKALDSDMPVFHNSGHITVGDRDILPFFSHLELESLPTGGWGYDHYPLSAAYVRNLDHDFLGMTGKFHTTWGEFGGFKHANALKYECAAMLAYGSKCSIGDQLHPNGQLDETTYALIGEAYADVEQKEAWCQNVKSAANVAVLSEAAGQSAHGREFSGDVGAARMLLESHIPFDLLDVEMEFTAYKVLILPDTLRLEGTLLEKIKAFLAAGGKLILSGESGLAAGGEGFALDLPVEHSGTSEYSPDYLLPAEELRPDMLSTPFVMYQPSQRIQVKSGKSLGDIYDPYFNREGDHFCSHQHTPYQPEASVYHAGVQTDQILYFAHPVFTVYRGYGTVLLKEIVMKAILAFIGEDLQVETSLSSQGRVSLMHQPEEQRSILHLLYANTITRGGVLPMSGGNISTTSPVEVIEELNPVSDVEVRVRPGTPVSAVRLEPEGKELAFEEKDGVISFTVDRLVCHQMVVLEHRG